MNKFWVVLSHTYMSKLKTKSFIITTAVMLAIILLMSNITSIIGFFDDGEKEKIGVMDESGQFYESLAAQLKETESDLQVKEISSEKDGRKQIEAGDLTGYLIIGQDEQGLPTGTYKANTISDENINNELSQALTNIKNRLVTESLNISPEQIASLYSPAAFDKVSARLGLRDSVHHLLRRDCVFRYDRIRSGGRENIPCHGNLDFKRFTGPANVCENLRHCFIEHDANAAFLRRRIFLIEESAGGFA